MMQPENDKPPRALTRHETHDLGMIIKDRAKVLRSHVADRAAACLADFEQKLAAVYSFDQDEVWKQAAHAALEVAQQSQEKIAARCKELGIPPSFAPRIEVSWHGRGENAIASRRLELRRVAKSKIEAMEKAAITKIDRMSLDLRTQVIAMGLMSQEAKLFLESLAPIDEVMRALDVRDIEDAADTERRRLRGGYYGGAL
jgi:hypothetical protein